MSSMGNSPSKYRQGTGCPVSHGPNGLPCDTASRSDKANHVLPVPLHPDINDMDFSVSHGVISFFFGEIFILGRSINLGIVLRMGVSFGFSDSGSFDFLKLKFKFLSGLVGLSVLSLLSAILYFNLRTGRCAWAGVVGAATTP